MATKAISELTSAPAVSTTDLFETSCENQSSSSGYSSHKQSLGDISDAIGEEFTHNSLNTTSKNLVGAINEVANDKNLSDTYDPTATYAVGDYCIYNTTLYKCVTAVESAENFDSNKWERCLITNELGQGGGSGGDPITELTGRLAAGQTTLTLTDEAITETGDHTIDLYTSAYGVNPITVAVDEGSITFTFDPQPTDLWVGVVIKDLYSESKTLQGTTMTATLTAGQTTLTFTNSNILSTSMLFITAQNSFVSPTNADTSVTNTVTYTFNAQSSDVVFKLLIVNM